MLNWFRKWKTRRERKNWRLACPEGLCFGGTGRYCLRLLSRVPPSPPGFIEPCLPTPSRLVPDGPRWAFEIKHDGFRFIARRDGGRVRVFSRNAKDWTDRVPLIVE